MNQIYSDEGLLLLLKRIAGAEATAGLGNKWSIYTNDKSPTGRSVLSDFTLSQVDFDVFTRTSVDLVLGQVIAGIGTIEGPLLKFKNLAVADRVVYGYVITNDFGTILIAAGRFDAAPVTVLPGDYVLVQPVYSDRSEFS
jgi:hypothetical protein